MILCRIKIICEDSRDYFGYGLCSAGDVNGDGIDVVIVGARYEDDKG